MTPAQPKGAQSGRYTAPIPRERRHSPPWYPYVIVTLLVLGVITIIMNYAGILPAAPSSWYLIGGIAGIVAGLLLATYYH